MADKKTSAETEITNGNIDGTESVRLAKGGSNFRALISSIKTYLVGSLIVKLTVSSGSFSGNTYTNAALIGKTLMIFSGGILLDAGTDYSFNSGTGAITMTAQDLIIQYW